MELTSLHPFETETVTAFVQAIQNGVPVSVAERAGVAALESLVAGNERGSFVFTYALASQLAGLHPTFIQPGVSLTTWELRIDRAVGMLMRPPSRLLIDAGLPPDLARRLPIRLELQRGMMGGAFIPARLMDEFSRTLDTHLERSLRRLVDAEYDAQLAMSHMIEVADYCRARNLGIYEAMDVNVTAAMGVIEPDRRRIDKALRERMELALKPPKKPGLLSRLRHRDEGSS